MFIFNVFNHVTLATVLTDELKGMGVKYKLPKKHKDITTTPTDVPPQVFQTPLCQLKNIDVILTGANVTISIPVFLFNACSAIEKEIAFEGIFRKVGSVAKQRHLKELLNSGKPLDGTCHVVDICNLVKLFFRELPEPIIPYYAHEMLLSCMLLSGETIQKEALLLSCLLLPLDHLIVLTYFFRFLRKVADHSDSNKMDSSNLAIVLTPSLMPTYHKSKSRTSLTIAHHIAVVKMLIECANDLGTVPDALYAKAHAQRGKKRRSASITRMFTGIRRMVGKATSPADTVQSPERSPRKRKTPELMPPAISVKRRREVADTTPGFCRMGGYSQTSLAQPGEKQIVSTPLRKSLPSAQELGLTSAESLSDRENRTKKRVIKSSKSASNLLLNKRKSLERKLSSMNWRKRRGSLKNEQMAVTQENNKTSHDDVVVIPRREYEEMKTRVNCMEHLLVERQNEDSESETLATQLHRDLRIQQLCAEMTPTQQKCNLTATPVSASVQNAFERVVEQSEQLAPQIRRDVRLRWSSERRVARSPSERKIGSIRRRSRELVRSNSAGAKTNLQRGRPNTRQSGLPSPRDNSGSKRPCKRMSPSEKQTVAKNPRIRQINPKNEHWRPLAVALASPGLKHLQDGPERRDSIACLRRNNLGMVQAKAKFFDSLNHSGEGEADRSNQSLEKNLSSMHKDLIRVRHDLKENRQPLIKPALGSAQLKTPRSQVRTVSKPRATPLKAPPTNLSTPLRGVRRSPRIIARSLSVKM